MSERLRNLPNITQLDSARDGIRTTGTNFTKEIKAQTNERTDGILREGRRTERGEKKNMQCNQGAVEVVVITVVVFLNQIKLHKCLLFCRAENTNQFWDHFSRLPLVRMRT